MKRGCAMYTSFWAWNLLCANKEFKSL